LSVGSSAALHVLRTTVENELIESVRVAGVWTDESIAVGCQAIDGFAIGSDDIPRAAVEFSAQCEAAEDPDPYHTSYLSREGGSWSATPVPSFGSSDPLSGPGYLRGGLALDRDDRPYVYDRSHFATSLTGWTWEEFPPEGPFSNVAMVVRDEGLLHVVAGTEDGRVLYMRREHGEWSTSLVEAVPAIVTIAASDRAIHIAYRSVDVRYARAAQPNGRDDDCDGEVW